MFARVFCKKDFIATPSNNAPYNLNFEFELEKPQDPTQSLITSTGYDFGNVTYFFKDEESSTENIRNIYRYSLNADDVEILDKRDCGTVNCSTGIVEINDFDLSAQTTISIFVRPASNDIAPKRNQIIEVDLTNTTVESLVDTIAVRGTSGASEYVTTPREDY